VRREERGRGERAGITKERVRGIVVLERKKERQKERKKERKSCRLGKREKNRRI